MTTEQIIHRLQSREENQMKDHYNFYNYRLYGERLSIEPRHACWGDRRYRSNITIIIIYYN